MNRKQQIRGLIQITVSVILLFLILRKVRWEEARSALAGMDLLWLALAWALFLAGVFVRAGRWQVLLAGLGIRRRLTELARWYFVGSFFNVILPTGFGGDAVRAAELAQDTRRPGPVVNSVLVDRYMGIMVLLPMGLVAGLAWPGTASPAVLALTATLFLGGLLAAWLLPRPLWTELARRPGLAGRLVRGLRLQALSEAVRAYDARTVLTALFISLVFNVLQIGWNVAIAQGLGLHLPLAAFLAFVPLTAVALLLPAFGGLGVRELSYVGLFAQAGATESASLALSLGVYAITVAAGLIGGAIYVGQGILRAGRRSRSAGARLPDPRN